MNSDRENVNIEIRGSLLTKNAILNFVGLSIPLLIGVITIPLIINLLGEERFGILALVWTIIGYFTVFDFGLGRTIIKFVAQCLGEKKFEKIPMYFWTAVFSQLLIGIILSIFLATSSHFLVERMFNISPYLASEAKSTFNIIFFILPIMFLSLSFRGLLQAFQRFDLVNLVRVPTSAASFVIPLVAFFGIDLVGIIALLAVIRLVAMFAYLLLCLRILPALRQVSFIRFNLLRNLFTYSKWLTISNIIAPFLMNIERLFIASLLTMSALSHYVPVQEMIIRLSIIPASMSEALFPAFSLLNTGKNDSIDYFYISSLKFLLLTMASIVLILVFFSREIIMLWLGGEFIYDSATILRILAIGMFFSSLGCMSFAILQGRGRPDVSAKIQFCHFIIAVPITWWSVKYLGIVGAAVIWSFRLSLEAILFFVMSLKVFKISPKIFYKNKFIEMIVTLTLVSVACFYSMKFIDIFWIKILLIMIILLFFLKMFWSYILVPKEKEVLMKLFLLSR